MSKKILVSLVSEQTIPNVELIKEKYLEVDALLFISTKAMEENGNREWIINALKDEIPLPEILNPIIVEAFSFSDIEDKLNISIKDENHYLVNLTGGTKVMSLAAHDFFKNVSSEMYYLTGRGQYIKVHPGRSRPVFELTNILSIKEYLKSYGFLIKNISKPIKSYNQVKSVLNYFLNSFDKNKDIEILSKLRSRRSKSITIDDFEGLMQFLKRINFKEKTPGKLCKYEVRFLSGDWLEEYLFYFLSENLGIQEDQIGISWQVEKNNIQNEFDVLVTRNNRLYLFECKTSIYIDSKESQTFIGDTIYKSDSLRNKLGLFAQTTIFTLSDLNKPKLKNHILRAENSKVKLIGRDEIIEETKLINALKRV